MTWIRRMALATLIAVVGLVPAGTASAGPLLDRLCHGDCPPQSYSPLRYWTPTLARASDCVHGPRLCSYPPDTHPEIPPSLIILKYRCRAADPAATLIPPPPSR